jgi:hypothetical protein
MAATSSFTPTSDYTIEVVPTAVTAGQFARLAARDSPVERSPGQQPPPIVDQDITWTVQAGTLDDPNANPTNWQTTGLAPGTYEAYLSYEEDGVEYRPDPVLLVVQAAALQPPVEVSLERSDIPLTTDAALWEVIRESTQALSYDRYSRFIDWIMSGGQNPPPAPPGLFDQYGTGAQAAENTAVKKYGEKYVGDWLPFPDIDRYRVLKIATEVFMMSACGVQLDQEQFAALLGPQTPRLNVDRNRMSALWNSYLQLINLNGGSKTAETIPYLALIRQKLRDVPISQDAQNDADVSFKILQAKLTKPTFVELIWSYWQEEGLLVQTFNALAMRFQNRRTRSGRDPLQFLDVDPLRPLNNLLWGFIQDEQHRLTVPRRSAEYVHEYGLSLWGKAVPQEAAADTRSRFLEAFHSLLHKASIFYKEDDDTTVKADPFPVLTALRDVHLILTEGSHNAYGDLPWTARQEMLMQQWLLARPEFREFLPTRIMVAYPEPWMDRVDAMKRIQGWDETSVRHFRDLAVTGEPVLLAIRFGDWSEAIDQNQAGNWARFWRQEVQWYIETYEIVTGVDLSSDTYDTRAAQTRSARFAQPAEHLRRRAAQRRQAVARPGGRSRTGAPERHEAER